MTAEFHEAMAFNLSDLTRFSMLGLYSFQKIWP